MCERARRWSLPILSLVAIGLASSCVDPPAQFAAVPVSSSPIAVSADGSTVWVVNPDSDSVGQIRTATGKLRREIEEARSCAAACDALTAPDPSRQAQPDLGRLDEAKLWYMGQRRRLEEETRRLETELEEAKEETRRQLDARGKWGGERQGERSEP